MMREQVMLVLVLVGCDPDDVVLGPKDDCVVAAMRCNGNVAEACGSDQRWIESMDCDEVAALSGGTWECRVDDEGGAYCEKIGVEDAGDE